MPAPPSRKRRAAAGIDIDSAGSAGNTAGHPAGSNAASEGSSAGYEGGYESGSLGGYVCSIIRGSVFIKIEMKGAYSGVNPCPDGKLAALFVRVFIPNFPTF